MSGKSWLRLIFQWHLGSTQLEMSVLVLATRNAHKVEELRVLLGDDFKVQTLDDFPSAPALPETAGSFVGNATLKVLTLAQWIGASLESVDAEQYVVADDSGLEVDALDGAPGIHSARYASLDENNSSDADNNTKLLRKLQDVPLEKRVARFVCQIALTIIVSRGDTSEAHLFEGVCEGHVAEVARGEQGFGYDPLFWVPEPRLARDHVSGNSMAEGLAQLGQTFKELRHLKTVMLFLFAYWFYMDGVDTIVRMAVDYGMSIGFESTDLITALLLVQFIGFPAALIFGRLGEKWGVKKSIFLAIGIYMLATIGGMQMTQKIEFYMLAAVIGLVQGGVQALSRSYYSRLIPSNQAAEYFGFYNMLGKFAVILGPILMGTVALLARNWLMPEAPTDAEVQMVGQLAARWSIGSILILFLIGGALLYFVDEDKGREEARYLENKSF